MTGISNPALLTQADAAFDAGHSTKGLALLREYNQTNSQDAATWHRQAIIEEQIGSPIEAGRAHYRCIELAPTNALGYLYAGYWLQQQEHLNAAASLYSLGHDLDAAILNLATNPSASDSLRQRSYQANRVLRQVLSQHHRDVCAKIPNAGRIANAVWVQTHDQAVNYQTANFAPELFYIPELEVKPFHQAENDGWAASVTAAAPAIKQELMVAIDKLATQDTLRPYLGAQFANHAGLGQLADSANWLAMDLFKNGELNQQVADFFPHTLSALDVAPTYGLDDNPFEVFFSLLKPHQQIAPHFGESNHALTVHLGLEIHPNCHLTVNSEQRIWKNQELLIFDDSFRHSAHNNSDSTRIVLIFSVWHPALSNQERSAVQQCFKARQLWLNQRQTHLAALLDLSK